MALSDKKLKYGVGFNDASYPVTFIVDGKRKLCPYYTVWQNMLTRCYCERFLEKNSTYRGCSVCEEWLTFSKFKKWMEKQDWESKSLDKDIISEGNKIYSPETCAFVNRRINNLLLNNKKIRGKYPLGVTFNKKKKRFVAQCNGEKHHVYVGGFDNAEMAHKAYLTFKQKVIREVANDVTDVRVKDALHEYAENINLHEKQEIL